VRTGARNVGVARTIPSSAAADGETLEDGLTDGLTDADGLTLGLTEADGLTDGLTEADGLTDADGLTLALGLTLADPVVDSCSAMKSPAVSPLTARVGLLVSPVLVLMRNSPRTSTAAALFRDRVPVIAEKLVEAVMAVVEFASFPSPRKYRRCRLDRPENADDPKSFAPVTSLVIGLVVPLVRTSV
jgi:hypothetical protein